MPDALSLYVDDSGSRLPDHNPRPTSPKGDWFGLGGVLVADADRSVVEARHDQLVATWPQIRGFHLHSVAIRHASDGFKWLGLDREHRARFLGDLSRLICGSPLLCIAAVIDRPGYMARYATKYGPSERWHLCKTAFSVLLERSIKYARSRSMKLRIYVEKSDKPTDGKMRAYVDDLCKNGMPFDPKNMGRYAPLTKDEIRDTVYEVAFKNKSSRLMQLADLCLYPMCVQPYQPGHRPYEELRTSGRLIDCVLAEDEIASRGIKYSCFDGERWSRPAPAADAS